MQVVILTSGIVAGRMGLEVRALHGQGNLVQLHRVTRDHHGITPQGPVRATLILDAIQNDSSLQKLTCIQYNTSPLFIYTSSLFKISIHPLIPPPTHKITLLSAVILLPVPEAMNIFVFIAGLYFYIEASGRNMGDVARLVTPHIQSNGNATCMVFYYHLYGHSIGSLRVKVGDQVLWQLSGNQGNSWYKATVPLNFDGTYRVR